MPIQYIAPYDLITNETEYNISGSAADLLRYTNDVSGAASFITWLIVIVWFAVSLGVYMYQKRNTGQGDLPMSFATGGFIASILTILLSLIPNLVNPVIFWAVLLISSIGVITFLVSKGEKY